MRGQRSHGRVLVQGSLVAAAAALFIQCGDSEPQSQFVPRDPCEGALKGLCGATCTKDDDCADRLHCAQGKCTAQCGGSDSLCPKGSGCSSRGRCTTGNGGSAGGIVPPPDGSAGSGASGGDAGVCADIALKLAPTTPTVVILIDQSSSMDAKFPNDSSPNDRWTVLRNSLMDPATGVIKRLEGQVRFGVVLYSAEDGASTQCPALTRIMPPRLNNHAGINAVYRDADMIDNTPTAESLQAVTTELAAFAEAGPKFIILATDGDPDRCADRDDHGAQSKQMSVDAVNAAWSKKIGTYVIAVGPEATASHLNDLAYRGQGIATTNQSRPLYFQPTSQTALVNAFTGIINGVRSCDFTLNGTIDPKLADRGRVTVDGSAVPLNGSNGWTVDTTGKKLTLHGTFCNTIKTGNHDIRAVFPCSAVVEEPVPE